MLALVITGTNLSRLADICRVALHWAEHSCLVLCRIRDLNDEINKLIREKGHWERRIVELGGPDYARNAPRMTDDEGNQVQGATGKGGGYKYFGAAKQLPGVRELFEKEAPRQIRRTRHQMFRHIDADYYGFRDDEDGVLEKVEAPAEKRMRAQVGFGTWHTPHSCLRRWRTLHKHANKCACNEMLCYVTLRLVRLMPLHLCRKRKRKPYPRS